MTLLNDSLFPLPLTTFELYMLLDDSPEYPMDSLRSLSLTGGFNYSAFELAVSQAVQRHPLMKCQVVKHKSGVWHWVPVSTPTDIRRITLTQDISAPFTDSGFPVLVPINLMNAPGLRIYCLESPETHTTQIVLQFHHSTSDGMGEMQFIADILVFYANAVDPSVNCTLPTLNPTVLKYRGKFGWTLAWYLRYFVAIVCTTRQFLLARVQFLVSPSGTLHDATPLTPYPQIREREMTLQQTTAYIQKSKRGNVTVNDALLADMAFAVQRWRSKKQITIPSGNFRISVPMNMRTVTHHNMPAANVVTMVFIDANKNLLTHRESLVQSMNRKMKWIHNKRQKYTLDLFFMFGQFIGRLFGKDISIFLKSRKSQATVCLSNLGRVLDDVPLPRNPENHLIVGEQILKSITAAPPIRYGTAISISALTYGGKIRLCLRYDHRVMNPDDADYILNEMLGEQSGT